MDFFKTVGSILFLFPFSFFSMRFLSVLVVQQYSGTGTATKKYRFIL